jgi:aspartyl-tRNA(Asn)/glutamyl-tRNA(Gln) amidotransferase subunit C
MSNVPPTLSEDEVARIAQLAHLELSADEITRMARDLGQILGYVHKLREVDVDHVAPTAHVQLERLDLRADEPEASLPSEAALREAPSIEQGGFSVPSFVDEG